MPVDNARHDSRFRSADKATPAGLIEQLNRFEGTPEQFLVNLLAVQCLLARASGATILHKTKEDAISILAIYPPPEKDSTAPVWLAHSIEFVKKQEHLGSQTTIVPLLESDHLYGQPATRHLVMIPLKLVSLGAVTAAFLIESSEKKVIQASLERLELTANLLDLYQMRLTLQSRQLSLIRLTTAMEVLSAANEHDKFAPVAMAFCNEIASKWKCRRAAIGFLKGKYVQLKFASHTEHFSRKMKLVQDIESAMEECLDQDTEVVYPVEENSCYIYRSSENLSKQHGPHAILSLPLRRDGEPIAVLTIEREPEEPFTLEEVETARLTCELCTARLIDLYVQDRWFGSKAAEKMRSAGSFIVGAKHTWAKLIAVAVFAALLFLIFASGTYRTEAPFILEAVTRQLVPAPFDGYLKTVGVSAGDNVEAEKTILATLEDSELKLELASAKAEHAGFLKQANAAMRDGNTAQSQIATANAEKVKAEIDLFEYKISRAVIVSPIGGTVTKGDLDQQIGAPVETGDVLFEVAPLDSLRAELLVSDSDISDIAIGQKGGLATASHPARKIAFVVEQINPAAELVNQRNIFRVRVKLDSTAEWMRPGMEGIAKVSIDQRSYAWMWSRKIVNWIRMKFWL